MAGITKCVTEGCPLAHKCYRKLAKDSEWQSLAAFKGGGDCRDFWPVMNLHSRKDKQGEK